MSSLQCVLALETSFSNTVLISVPANSIKHLFRLENPNLSLILGPFAGDDDELAAKVITSTC
jgi:hypothetical protein